MRRFPAVLFATCLCFTAIGQTPSEGDQGWPTEVTSGNTRLVIYRPQADTWKKNRLEARCAVTVTRQGPSKPPLRNRDAGSANGRR